MSPTFATQCFNNVSAYKTSSREDEDDNKIRKEINRSDIKVNWSLKKKK